MLAEFDALDRAAEGALDDGLEGALGARGVDAMASELLGYASDLDDVLRRLDQLGGDAATAAPPPAEEAVGGS